MLSYGVDLYAGRLVRGSASARVYMVRHTPKTNSLTKLKIIYNGKEKAGEINVKMVCLNFFDSKLKREKFCV
jgi:hypothetical protein